MKKSQDTIASGIDALVDKLKREGVDAAKQESEQILAEANAQAQQIIASAKQQAEQQLESAHQKIMLERKAAEDALKIAYRDLVLDLKGHLLNRFSEDVERLVSSSVLEPEVIKKIVIAAAGRIVDQSEIQPGTELEILLPPQVLEMDDITRDPQSAAKGPLAEFVFAIQEQILAEGIQFAAVDKNQQGIKIRLVNDKIEVDLTDSAIAELLLTYLNPRFRAVLDGIIH